MGYWWVSCNVGFGLWTLFPGKLGRTVCLSIVSHFMVFKIFILSVWMFYLHVFLCTTCVPGTCKGQKRALDLLGLSYHVGARNWTRSSQSAASVLNHWIISSAPIKVFFVGLSWVHGVGIDKDLSLLVLINKFSTIELHLSLCWAVLELKLEMKAMYKIGRSPSPVSAHIVRWLSWIIDHKFISSFLVLSSVWFWLLFLSSTALLHFTLVFRDLILNPLISALWFCFVRATSRWHVSRQTVRDDNWSLAVYLWCLSVQIEGGRLLCVCLPSPLVLVRLFEPCSFKYMVSEVNTFAVMLIIKQFSLKGEIFSSWNYHVPSRDTGYLLQGFLKLVESLSNRWSGLKKTD